MERTQNYEQSTSFQIRPSVGWSSIDIKEIFHYRNLLMYLVWRDVRVVFTQTGLGIFWIVVQPLATVIVISIVLGIFVKVPSGNIPYPVMVLSGLVPWNYFSSVVVRSSASMMGNAHLITKVYFPRAIIPLVPLFATLVDFAVLLTVLLVLAMVNGYFPALTWLALPILVLLTVGMALGCSLWISPANVKYRDIGNLLPVLLQIGVYLSPILYLSSYVPAEWHWLYALNPMVGIIEGFRWSLLGAQSFPVYSLAITVAFVALSISGGVFFFHRMEDAIVDLV